MPRFIWEKPKFDPVSTKESLSGEIHKRSTNQIISMYSIRGGTEDHGYLGISSTSFLEASSGGHYLTAKNLRGTINYIKYSGTNVTVTVRWRVKIGSSIWTVGTQTISDPTTSSFGQEETFDFDVQAAMGLTNYYNNLGKYARYFFDFKVNTGRAGFKFVDAIRLEVA